MIEMKRTRIATDQQLLHVVPNCVRLGHIYFSKLKKMLLWILLSTLIGETYLKKKSLEFHNAYGNARLYI